jgi:heat-inducible transcriptional repressor
VAKIPLIRKKQILNIIVQQYITTALPVASEAVQRNYDLGVSSATIRNDMASLEEEGFISRPHTSAGCIPLDKGYRLYVESLSSNVALSVDEQYQIRDTFNEVADEVERWLKLAATLMSRLAGNAALVTFPKAPKSKFRHLELVSLHDFLALLILVISEATLKQQLLTFDTPVTQDKLTAISNKLNAKYTGLTRTSIMSKKPGLAPDETQVSEVVLEIMAVEDKKEYEEPYLEGLRLMLSQPEFVKKERMLGVLELLEASDWLKNMLKKQTKYEKINVVIGQEGGNEALQDLSLVLSRYEAPNSEIGGTIGIIGPTRMDYQRAISTVAYIAETLSYLMSEVYRKN